MGTLHRGELEAIVAAQELKADFVVLDDRLAHTLMLSTIGTVGVVRASKERGLIPDIKSRLDRLIEGPFRLSAQLYAAILGHADESP